MSDPLSGHVDRRHRTVFRREPGFFLLLEIYDLFDSQRENWCQCELLAKTASSRAVSGRSNAGVRPRVDAGIGRKIRPAGTKTRPVAYFCSSSISVPQKSFGCRNRTGLSWAPLLGSPSPSTRAPDAMSLSRAAMISSTSKHK